MSKTKNIKILCLHWGFIPGGVAKYAEILERLSLFAPLKLKSVIITAPTWALDDVALSAIDKQLVKIRGRLDLSWIWKVRGILKREKPDLIFTFGFNGCFAALLTRPGLKIPIVSSWHGNYHPTTFIQKVRAPFFELLSRILFRYIVKEIVTVSNYSKGLLIKKGVSPDKIASIYNGISVLTLNKSKAKEIRDGLRISDDEILFGTACRLDAQKGLHWFLQAIQIAIKSNARIKFVIWGDGPQNRILQEMARTLQIQNQITFAGYRSDIEDCLQALDVFVMSSFAEYFSIALLEAMRAGLPIIATDVGGNPEAIEHNKHGILVPVGDPSALADGILKLAGNPDLRQALGEAAQKRFYKEFTSERMARNTAQWLFDCALKYKAK